MTTRTYKIVQVYANKMFSMRELIAVAFLFIVGLYFHAAYIETKTRHLTERVDALQSAHANLVANFESVSNDLEAVSVIYNINVNAQNTNFESMQEEIDAMVDSQILLTKEFDQVIDTLENGRTPRIPTRKSQL